MTDRPALVHLRGAGEPEPTAAHALLSQRFRVIVLEAGEPASPPDSPVRAIDRLGPQTFNLLAGGAGGPAGPRPPPPGPGGGAGPGPPTPPRHTRVRGGAQPAPPGP